MTSIPGACGEVAKPGSEHNLPISGQLESAPRKNAPVHHHTQTAARVVPDAQRLMVQDLRSAFRSMARAPGVSAVLFLSLALGTGATAAVGGIVHGLLFRPPAGVNGAGLVNIYTSEFSGAPYGPSSYADHLSLKAEATDTAFAAADDHHFENVRLGEAEQRARIVGVSANFFSTLELQPYRGRLLTEGDRDRDPQPIVISFALWKSAGGSDEIVGKTLLVGTDPHPVVGVAPPRFRGLHSGRLCDVWIPLRESDDRRGDRRLSVVARLDRGARLEQLQPRLDAIADTLANRYPETNRGTILSADSPRRFLAVPYSQFSPDARVRFTLVAAVVVGSVLLLLASACVNAGSLLLSRSAARRRELAVKVALGASPASLIRQLLLEGLVVGLTGGATGLLIAEWTIGAIPAFLAPEHAEMLNLWLDVRLMLLTAAIACTAGLVAGLLPLGGGTISPTPMLLRRDSGDISEQHGSSRLRALLVTSQIAFSTVLLVTTGVLSSGLSQALAGDFGQRAEDIAVFAMRNPGIWPHPEQGVEYQKLVAKTLTAMSEVAAVGWASTLPLSESRLRQFRLEAEQGANPDVVELNVTVVSASYFDVMKIPRIEGRAFDDSDRPLTTPVAIVDETLARRYFGATAKGRHLVDVDGARFEIVGVVRGGRYRTLQPPPAPTVYLAVTQEYLPGGFLFVRTAHGAAPMLEHLSQVLEGIDSRVAIGRSLTLDAHLSGALVIDRLTMTFVAVCGMIALGMSLIGVSGVMTDAVLRRTREIGLRVALGAGRVQVARLVFGEAFGAAAVGAIAGIVLALVCTRLAQSVVRGFPGPDLLTLIATPSLLAIVVATAAFVPLRRALGISPTIALGAI